MGSSSSKHQKKANSSRSTQPTKRQDARRPVDQSRPLPPQPTYSPPTRNQQLPPQSKHSRHRQLQAPAPSGRAPTQSRKAPPRPRRNPSPSTQAGNRQSVLWPGLLDADYQAALPPGRSPTETHRVHTFSAPARIHLSRAPLPKKPQPQDENPFHPQHLPTVEAPSSILASSTTPTKKAFPPLSRLSP